MERGRDRSPRLGEGGMAANGDYKTFLPSMLQRATTRPRDTPRQVKKQETDVRLGRIRRKLLERKRGSGGGGYVMDDEDLLWAISTGERLA